MGDKIFLSELEASCIIGIFDWEREVKQKILIDMEIPADARKAAVSDAIEDTVDYKSIAKYTLQFVSKSSFFLIETLAEKLSQELLRRFHLPAIKVRISKPGAVRGSRNVGIEITRAAPGKYYISLGSNIHPEENIPKCLTLLREYFSVLKTSSIYETPPLGTEGTSWFWNAAVLIETALSPEKLRKKLTGLENLLGRTRTENKFAPRTIDLDLLPSSAYQQQAFVMVPLAEIAPQEKDEETGKTFAKLAADLQDQSKAFRKISTS